MPILVSSINGASGGDPDLSMCTSSYLGRSSALSKGSSGDENLECAFPTRIKAGPLHNPSVYSNENMSGEHDTKQLWEKNRIPSTSISLSINATGLNESVMLPQSPLRLIKLESDSCDHAISPIYAGIETLPHFFDCPLNASFFPYFGDESAEEQHYLSSPQARHEEASVFKRSPCKAQESSKDYDIISTMFSPLPFLFPSAENEVNVGAGKRQGKSLERLLQYKNKKTKAIKGTKRPLPIKKRLSRPKRGSKSDDEDNDYEYDESDDKENQSAQIKPLHTKATRCIPLIPTTLINVTYSSRNIEHYDPSDDVVALLAPAKATEVTFPVIDRCKCTKSRCLKLYCDCFQAGQVCNSSCECISCENTKSHSKPGGLRFLAIESLLLRRPDAFEHRPKKAGEGCKCKKNRCLKKYCDCFNSGINCSSRCNCEDCKNFPDEHLSLENQKVIKSSRRVTRHAEKAQDEKEQSFVSNRRGVSKIAGQEENIDGAFPEFPSPMVQTESDDSSSENNVFFSKHDFLSSLPNEDVMPMMHYGFSSTGTPTNMEAI